MDRVVINEPTEQENITLEQQAAMQEEAKAAKETQTQQSEPVEEATEDRPEWLDEKFKSPEELAKAYEELQKKQSSDKPSKEDKKAEAEAETLPINDAISKAQDQFAESGELTDKMYVELEKAGIPSEYVRAYIAGQEAVSTGQALEVQETIGGRGNYEAMTEWAQENLNDTDIEAYDDIVTSGTVEQAKMAVQGMYARFLSGGGKAPNLTQGSTSGDSVKPFGSAAQVTEAMRDPRYKNDPAYRDSIEKRIAVSNVL